MSPAALLATVLAAADPDASPEVGSAADAKHWSFAVTPLLNYSTDAGLGLGVRGKLARLADGVQPYWMSLEAQAYGSTGGTQLHFVSIDLPRLAGSDWRLDALGGFWRNVGAHYYGLGDHLPLSEEGVDTYVETAPLVRARARRKLGRALSLLLGYRFMWQLIDAPAGSRLSREAPFGVQGGGYSELSAGLAWDTRDDELSPTRGLLLETSARTTLQALGSSGNSVAVFSSASLYQPIAGGWLLAVRMALDAAWGDVPFNRQGDFGTLVSPALVVSGVGGGLSVRGLSLSEYVGKLKILSNVEVRFPLFGFQFFGERLALSGVAFVDAGKVDLGAVHLGVGGGLRIRWGRFFLVRLDAGYSEGGVRIYADFGEAF